ncbi:uncharacterized protein RHOBADRAFT_67060 [Rhodotorula graminis WP1]|uniref:RRM domain-containing protein n=1 Tax=Rhodotorula graminis (strain WP1) TaxID=578459 RepID=A0A0N8PZ72_RHOGW|nr:uncharacterized protein RHOBADRAFT_67060 [Rhodotorula graminis WP1]KPV71517.1 hypothetical protein RHOBADRAFT_67060 [Rhodotorula graminis WP1]
MSGRRLYVGRIPQQASRADFEQHFGAVGRLVDIRIMAGFAFLEYESLRDAEQAVADFNNHDFCGERILVEFAKPPRSMMDDRFGGPPRGAPYGGGYGGGYPGGPGGYGPPGGPGGYGAPRGFDRPPRQSGYRLTISGLREGTTWQEIKDFGRLGGNVGFADVDRRDPTIGFIEYSSRYDAEEAIRKLDGTELNGAVVAVKDESGGASGGRDAAPRGDEGYSRGGRDRYDERDSRRRSPSPRRRSPSPRRSRSPAPRRRSPSPAPVERERERERSPVRDRSRSRSPRGYRD